MDIGVLMCLRVHAIYNKSRSVMILLVVLMMPMAGLAAAAAVCELAINAPFEPDY